MPPEPSVTSACEGPRLCTLRYSSALLPKSFERPGPKSVSPATYCSGVEVVVWWRRIVDMRAPYSMRSDSVNFIAPFNPRNSEASNPLDRRDRMPDRGADRHHARPPRNAIDVHRAGAL